MIVVSNTSPLTNLAAIGQFDLLRRLYGAIHIAEGVWDELHANGQAWPGYAEVAAAHWIERHPVQQPVFVNLLRRDLDRGEAETIALAVDLEAEMVLIEEQEGRHAAQTKSLPLTTHINHRGGVGRSNGITARRAAGTQGRRKKEKNGFFFPASRRPCERNFFSFLLFPGRVRIMSMNIGVFGNQAC